jgi:hypothetical protein
MNRPAGLAVLGAAWLLAAAGLAAAPHLATPTAPIHQPEAEGRALAARLRDAVPDRDSAVSGVLLVTQRDGRTNAIPVRSTLTLQASNWLAVYETQPAGDRPAERLVIVHAPGQSNAYAYAVAPRTDAPLPEASPLDPAALERPFAGTDFWLSDLGLEFLHWPRQRLLRLEMTRGRSCRVLESLPPAPSTNGCARIVSWIDVESDGVLRAEAYDARNKLVKEFNVGSFEKVEGQWQLRNLKIKDARTRRVTELLFELKRPAR